MSEVLGLKTNAGNSVKGNIMGMGTQAVGLKPGDPNAAPIYDENGFELASAPEPSWLANSFYTGLSNLPGATATFGFQGFRGSNTILHGGTGRANNRAQTFNPRNWNKYSSERVFHDAVPDLKNSTIMDRVAGRGGNRISDTWRKDRHGYSPFNLSDDANQYGSKLINRISKKGALTRDAAYTEKLAEISARSTRPPVARAVDEAMGHANSKTKALTYLEKQGLVKADGTAEKLFGRGMMSHTMAATRMEMLGNAQIGSKIATNASKAVPSAALDGAMTGRQAGLEYASAAAGGQGAIGGRMMGFAQGARHGESAILATSAESYSRGASSAAKNLARGGMTEGMAGATFKDFGTGLKTAYRTGAREAAEVGAKTVGKEVAGAAAKTVGKEAASIGAKTIAKEGMMAAGKFGASFMAGLASGPIGWIADIALTAWMVYDLAKLGTKLATEMVIKPATHFAQEGFKSFKGNIDKAPMGMGFKDNSVAMTARQRGVMAISNSRLNARSVLGSEAAGIHAHFG